MNVTVQPNGADVPLRNYSLVNIQQAGSVGLNCLSLDDGGRFLNNNGLRSLERGVFDELTSLEWLKLNKNRLRHISPAVFSRLVSLKYL